MEPSVCLISDKWSETASEFNMALILNSKQKVITNIIELGDYFTHKQSIWGMMRD